MLYRKNFWKESILAEGSQFKGQKVIDIPYILKYLKKQYILIKLVSCESLYVILLIYYKKSSFFLKTLPRSELMKFANLCSTRFFT